MTAVTLDHIRAALALDDFDVVAAQRRMIPHARPMRRSSQREGEPRRASVLLLLFPDEGELSLALILRSQNPDDVHSGQVSFPGGSQEPGETVVETALRETREELGFNGPVQLIGNLTCVYILPSDFEVRPVVGYVSEKPAWTPDTAEVVEVLECPVAWLMDDARKISEDWTIRGQTLRVPWYALHDYKVWGATAMILSEFEQRLKQVLNEQTG